MSLEEQRQGTGVVVRMLGNYRAGDSAVELEGVLDRIVREEKGPIVLDMTNLKTLDSTALGVIAGCGRFLHAVGRELYLAGPNERVALLFKLTQLDAVFPIVPTVESALGLSQ